METVRTNLCAQLEEARHSAETIKDELEGELDKQTRMSDDLRVQGDETQAKQDAEIEALRATLELESLKRLEEVRGQFDREREWFRSEREQHLSTIAQLKLQLQNSSEKMSNTGNQVPGESSKTDRRDHMYDAGNACGENSVSEVHASAIIEQPGNSRSCRGSQLTVSPQLISSCLLYTSDAADE